MVYTVDAEESRDADKNSISITTILKNDNVMKANGRKIQNGEIF